MNRHVTIEVLLRFGRMFAQLTGVSSVVDVSIPHVLGQARRTIAAHFAHGALVAEDVESHVTLQKTLRWVILVAVRTLESLHWKNAIFRRNALFEGYICFRFFFTFQWDLSSAVIEELVVAGEHSTAMGTSDSFFFGVAFHVVSQFMDAWVVTFATGPFAFDTTFDSVATRVVVDVPVDVVQVMSVIVKGFEALFPLAEVS